MRTGRSRTAGPPLRSGVTFEEQLGRLAKSYAELRSEVQWCRGEIGKLKGDVHRLKEEQDQAWKDRHHPACGDLSVDEIYRRHAHLRLPDNDSMTLQSIMECSFVSDEAMEFGEAFLARLRRELDRHAVERAQFGLRGDIQRLQERKGDTD